ncbi:UDP-N-acetylglucosamine transporter TMEM241 homolog isoform X3 [Scyliorhinus torazame]|uniref:UDP-N-acetylglucosamine transporter TMEM241 homolog isoform X3 n=1 Tax=Scyliorhinus torazame TaxID=75743 RepID=UPI003B5AA479
MWLKGPALCYSLLFLASYFTNKYVLSHLKFTYPTIFQGWQTFVGSVFLQIAWKLGRVEMSSNVLWSAKVSWIPGALLFVGNIYAGSRALSKLPIPFFLLLQNTSEVIVAMLMKITRKEKLSLTKFLSALMIFLAAVILPLSDPQFDPGGYFWATIHFVCVGGYKVFQKLSKSYSLSMVILILAAHPSGDASDALEFPHLYSYRFLSGCCVSGTLGVCLMLVSVKVKSSLSVEHYGIWILVTKANGVLSFNARGMEFKTREVMLQLYKGQVERSLGAFSINCTSSSSVMHCVGALKGILLFGALGEALLVYAERNGAEIKG